MISSIRTMLVFAGAALLGGCGGSSSARYDHEFFQQPPEIWERDGGYHVRLFEPKRDVIGYSIAEAEIHGSEVHVWLWPPHSSGSNPNRLLPLGLAIPAGPPPTFLWKDPDGTLHPMKVRRGI